MTRMVQPDPEIEAMLEPSNNPDIRAMGGAFEAADKNLRDLILWQPPIQSVDSDVLPGKALADARVNDITRNDAYVDSGRRIHQDSIVGVQYRLSAQPNRLVLDDPRFDETWENEYQEEVEAKFGAWAESEDNWPDASRRNTFTGLVRLAVGVAVSAGEALATVEWLRDQPRPMQTAIQMIEVNRLCDPGDRAFDPAVVRGGIEMNSYGAPVAYYIRRGQLDRFGFSALRNSYKWVRIAAVKPKINRRQVIHIMEQSRPAQTRGISQMMSALKEMKITKKFRDVTLQNAVVNASFAAAIESELPTEAAFETLGSKNVGEAVTDYATAYLGAVSQYTNSAKHMHIDGVKIPHFFPGTKLHLTPMGTPGGVGQEFEASLLRYIAANLGVSYEQLSKDYSETNYSSARASMLETWKYMQGRKRIVADRFANMVYKLFLEEAFGRNMISSIPNGAPSFYEGMNGDAYAAASWLGAGFGQIDELKETQAATLRIKTNLSTLEQEYGRQGRDWRQSLRQIARERKFMRELEIPLPEDSENNTENAITGAVRESSTGEAETPGGREA